MEKFVIQNVDINLRKYNIRGQDGATIVRKIC